jgi:hypothetical protein
MTRKSTLNRQWLKVIPATERNAILISLIFLFLGFGAVWAIKFFVNVDKDSVFISILFMPALVYLIVSGKLIEFKGPGGLEAKFSETAKESVTMTTLSKENELSVQDTQIIEKGQLSLEKKIQEIDESKPIIMTLTLGKSDYCKREAVLEHIETLSKFRNFRFIVFLDKDNRFAAYISCWALKGLLKNVPLGDEFINSIKNDKLTDLLHFSGIIQETISTQTTNSEALREMTKQSSEVLVVVNENRYLCGVVEREQILSKMLLSLVN